MAARNLFETFEDNHGPSDDNDSELDLSMSDEEEFIPDDRDLDSELDSDLDSDSAGARSSDSDSDEVGERGDRGAGPSSVQSPRDRNLNIPTYRAKDGQIWLSEPPVRGRTREQNIFTIVNNRTPDTRNKNSPADIFGLFLTQEMMNEIVICTNEEGQRQKGDNWKATDIVELDALVGIFLWTGVQNESKSSTDILWQPLVGEDYVRATMSRERFFQLMQALRFDHRETRRIRQQTDKMAAFRNLYMMHQENLRRHYIPGPFLTVDEQLVPFRGRCSFIQYIPSKPGKYGLKIFWVVDAENAYPLNYIVYIGKEDNQPARRPPGAPTHGASMLLRLVEPFTGKGRNVTCDNYFTDDVVTGKLLQKRTTLVGTVRSDKRFLPAKFSGKKELNLNESVFGFQDERLICSYQGHRPKNVILVSSMHENGDIDETNARRKPQVVLFYNQTKGGVDTMDKMALASTTKRATKRWPMVLFYNLLDTSTIAARIIFGMKNPGHELSKKNSRGNFIREIAKTLIRDHMVRRQETLIRASRPLKDLMETCLKDMGVNTASARPANPAAQQGGTRKRGRCGMCPWKEDRKGASKCKKCNMFLCKEHSVVVCDKCL